MHTGCWSNSPALVIKQLSKGHCNDSKHSFADFGERGEETAFFRLARVCIKGAVSDTHYTGDMSKPSQL